MEIKLMNPRVRLALVLMLENGACGGWSRPGILHGRLPPGCVLAECSQFFVVAAYWTCVSH